MRFVSEPPGLPPIKILMSGYDKPTAGAWEVLPGKKLLIRWPPGASPQ